MTKEDGARKQSFKDVRSQAEPGAERENLLNRTQEQTGRQAGSRREESRVVGDRLVALPYSDGSIAR